MAGLRYKSLILFPVLILSVVVILLLYETAPSKNDHDKRIWPTKRELRQSFWRERKLLIVYATGQPEAAKAYLDFANRIRRSTSWLQITAKADSAVDAQELSASPLSLVGNDFRNPHISRIINELPVRLGRSSFTFGDAFVSKQSDVFVLGQYPNPLNLSMPLTFIGSQNDAAVAQFVKNMKEFFSHSGEFRVFRAGQGHLLAFFEEREQGPWTVEENKIRIYENSGQPVSESAHYRLTYRGSNIDAKRLAKIGMRQESRLMEMVRRLTPVLTEIENLKPIRFVLYESPEAKGLITANTDLAHFEERASTVHALYNNKLDGTDFYADARLLLKRKLGDSRSRALSEGFAMTFTHQWGKRGYRAWAKTFYTTGNANSLHEVLNNEIYRRESYLFMRPLAGTLVDFLIEKVGLENFIELYREWPEKGLPAKRIGVASIEQLDRQWRSYLERLPETSRMKRKKHVPVFQKGFSYAHEGYRIYNGYLSQKGFESLSKLNGLGTNWISITPFGYLDNRNKPGYFHFSFGAGSENDESVVTAMHQAADLGMRAMLKPHVLMNSRNFGWPGEVEMKNEQDWKAFYSYYNKWIRHYAVLAEIYDFDLFCIGTELLHTTTPSHTGQWRQIIRNIRSLYSGPLTYAANWWQEFEQIEFWDELDYIGMNCYYPLSDQEHAEIEDLKHGVEKIMPIFEKAVNRFNKPVLLTEIGFTSTAQSWKQPHEDGFGTPPFMDDQVKCYNAVFESFKDKPWFFGFYWWKWPTYLERGGTRHSSFTPNGKPTEKVIANWYRQDWTR